MDSCIIVAGGRSRRFGEDKRRLRVWGANGPMLLEHVAAVAASLCDDVVVVLNDAQDWRQLPARLIRDNYPDAGPLGGLASGLAACRNAYALTLACDLPLLQPALLRLLLGQPRPYDALVPLRVATADAPRNRRDAEPLLAVYQRSCLPAIEACLVQGQRQMLAPFAQLDVRFVPPETWAQADSAGMSFVNLNRPEDLARVQQLLGNVGRSSRLSRR